jgi:hypothetical protein
VKFYPKKRFKKEQIKEKFETDFFVQIYQEEKRK